MKHAIMGCCLFLSSMFLILICATQYQLQIKHQELYSIAQNSSRNAITYMYNHEQVSDLDVVQVVKKSISKRMMKTSDIQVSIHTLDCANGIVRMTFTSTFEQMNGKNKRLKVERTMMIDQKKG